ncbi:MAG TPA: ABC transporter permease, partial [Chitinophagaceae bacterium]|nr:ABC transporter permease [Chitinophagaceae bacterium]
MFRHNLLIVFRNFKRFKGTFLINIIGLSTGLACTLLIYLWVSGELNFDKFHAKDDRLYQIMENQQLEEGIKTTDGTTGALADALKQEMPEIEYVATVTPAAWFPKVTLTHNEKSIRGTGQFAGADFFNIFSYELTQGNKDQVLADKKSIVISEELAKRMFGTTENVVGKPIKWQWQAFAEEYLVSGVFKSNPNSSAQFDYLLPFAWLKERFTFLMEWGNYGPNTFVVLKPGSSAEQFNAKLAGFMKKKLPETNRTLFAAKYSDNYLYGKYENGVQAGGRIEYVKLFSIIAIFILVIACVNFMNLSTAKASQRMKEVGLKKTLGATRKSLIFQYFAESLLIAFISLILAVIMVL